MFDIFLAVVSITPMQGRVFGGYPEQHIAVVARRSQQFAPWTPPHHIDRLRVFGERREVGDFPVFAVGFYLPYLWGMSALVVIER